MFRGALFVAEPLGPRPWSVVRATSHPVCGWAAGDFARAASNRVLDVVRHLGAHATYLKTLSATARVALRVMREVHDRRAAGPRSRSSR